MSNPNRLADLRNILAELYPDDASMRRVASDAGLDMLRIRFDSHAINNWQAILAEAQRANQIDALLSAVLDEYPTNPKFRQVADVYRDSVEPSINSQDADTNTPIQPNSPDKQIDIFLSYNRIDSEVMQRLRDDLQAAGFTVWTDDVGLEPGTPSWQRAIEEAIQAVRCVIVLLSPEAKKSKWVEIEVSLAEDLGLRIFPLLVRGEERNAVLFRLLTTQRIDLRTDYQKTVTQQLIPALQRYLPKSQPSEVIETEKPKLSEVSEPNQAKLSEGNEIEQTKPPEITKTKQYKLPDVSETEPVKPLNLPVKQTSRPNKLGLILRITGPLITIVFTIIFGVPWVWKYLDTQTFTPAFTLLTILATPTSTPQANPMWTNPKDGAVYVWIPGGIFTMGPSEEHIRRYIFSIPSHQASVDGFWIMQKEVTNAQYARCITAGVCEKLGNISWNNANYSEHPVVNVDWFQAQSYAKWVGGSLPTEAEWEYACRGTDGRIYPWGNDPASAERLNYAGSNISGTMPVGSYPDGASPYGMLDMAGNVWEWTSSLNKLFSYQVEDNRRLRGGSFTQPYSSVRCTELFSLDPHNRYADVGFRVSISYAAKRNK